jgi:hypothetical protein
MMMSSQMGGLREAEGAAASREEHVEMGMMQQKECSCRSVKLALLALLLLQSSSCLRDRLC